MARLMKFCRSLKRVCNVIIKDYGWPNLFMNESAKELNPITRTCALRYLDLTFVMFFL